MCANKGCHYLPKDLLVCISTGLVEYITLSLQLPSLMVLPANELKIFTVLRYKYVTAGFPMLSKHSPEIGAVATYSYRIAGL